MTRLHIKMDLSASSHHGQPMQIRDTARTNRACNSCRLLKIRCIVNDNAAVLSCENCEHSGKDCVFMPRTRTRRRKRADVRVTELENEVRTLASLLQRNTDDRRAGADHPGQSTTVGSRAKGLSSTAIPSSSSTSAGLESLNSNYPPTTEDTLPYLSRVNDEDQRHIRVSPLRKTRPIVQKDFPLTNSGLEDVITRGILSWSNALYLFERYRSQLTPCYPIVPLNNNTDPAKFRRERPMLFLAIITAAAATSSDQLRDTLHDEVLRVYADCIMVKGVKSLELLQALLVTVAWYRPCGSYHDTKYLQYTQAASLMAHELRLGTIEDERRAPLTESDTYFQVLSNSTTEYSQDSERGETDNIQCYRTLLAAYVQSSTKDLMSHSPTVPPLPTRVAACLQALEAKSHLSVFDRDLIVWARLQLLTQEARRSFRGDGSEDTAHITDSHVNLAVCAHEKQLLSIMKSEQPRPFNGCLEITYHANILHLNEIALHEDYSPRDFHPPYSLRERSTDKTFHAGAAYIKAIMKCISSSHLLLDTFLALDEAILSAAPSVIFVRMTYAATILLKIFLLVTATTHPLATVLHQEQLQLPKYLKSLESHLMNIEHNLSYRSANKFLDIILRLQRRYESHQFQVQVVNQSFDQSDIPPGVTLSHEESAVPYNIIDSEWLPQHPGSFIQFQNTVESRTSYPSGFNTTRQMHLHNDFPSDVSAGQGLPFPTQDMEYLWWNS